MAWLYDMTWQDVELYLKTKDTIILPVGSTEQHGLHLPLGTDSYVAIQLAEEAGRRTDTIVASPLWYGWTPHHMGYTGTASLKAETLTQVVVDLCESFIYHGFKKIIVVNGHREANLPPLKIAASKVRNSTGAYVAIVDPFYIGDTVAREIRTSEPGGIGHADELETSHMLYLKPELVDMSKSVKNIPPQGHFHHSDPFVSADRLIVPSSVESNRVAGGPSGVTADPTVASVEKGKVYHQSVMENFVQAINHIAGIPVEIKKIPEVNA
ncbi:creatininase family protein [Alicyclobacillus mengziensis]|uniref:Creatininase family protein n=1 Tax=Alicyclobacillus mengziensis TaxID=2931921 RepID=A0A9X7Z978_9BACL|nr:creatininase family protein [Alicyclobacillus mengziensis]QSO49310.1 creatininase family protein [Alicyclobacillus mengziensis]